MELEAACKASLVSLAITSHVRAECCDNRGKGQQIMGSQFGQMVKDAEDVLSVSNYVDTVH